MSALTVANIGLLAVNAWFAVYGDTRVLSLLVCLFTAFVLGFEFHAQQIAREEQS